MTDLEKLIREKQDQLRGRPEDWIDRFGVWRRGIDWPALIFIVACVTIEVLILDLLFGS